MEEIKAIDINLDEVKSNGTAYYRIDEGFKKFLEKCLEKHEIIGFEWEIGSWNFGIILKNKENETI